MRRCRKADEHPGAADPKPDFTASRLGRVARYSKKHIGALEEFCTKAYGSFGWYREIKASSSQRDVLALFIFRKKERIHEKSI